MVKKSAADIQRKEVAKLIRQRKAINSTLQDISDSDHEEGCSERRSRSECICGKEKATRACAGTTP